MTTSTARAAFIVALIACGCSRSGGRAVQQNDASPAPPDPLEQSHRVLEELDRAAMPPPRMALDAAAIAVARATGAGSVPCETVVANFATASDAHEAFAAFKNEGPARQALRLFGQSLFVSLGTCAAPARDGWIEQLSRRTGDVLVASAGTAARARLAFAPPSQQEADRIDKEIADYFLAAPLHPVPPWFAPDARTPERRAQHDRARRTYAQLMGRPGVDPFASDPVGSYESHNNWILDQFDTDAKVAAMHKRLFPFRTAKWDRRRLAAEMGPLLGQLELTGGKPAPRAAALEATGTVWYELWPGHRGYLLSVQFLRFGDPSEGLAAMVAWLGGRGCTDFRYDFVPGTEPAACRGAGNAFGLTCGDAAVSPGMREVLEKHQSSRWDLEVSSLPAMPGNAVMPQGPDVERFAVPAPDGVMDNFTYGVLLNKATGEYWIGQSGGFAGSHTVFGPGRTRPSGAAK